MGYKGDRCQGETVQSIAFKLLNETIAACSFLKYQPLGYKTRLVLSFYAL